MANREVFALSFEEKCIMCFNPGAAVCLIHGYSIPAGFKLNSKFSWTLDRKATQVLRRR